MPYVRSLTLFLLACGALFGQSLQTINYYSSTDLIYTCTAYSTQPKTATITVSAASNASPVSFTATAHGFDYPTASTNLPTVKITGGTLNWTPINGVWVATVTSANAFTIAVDSTTFGALTGTLVVTTLAPLTTKAMWLVQRNVYASNLRIWSGFAVTPLGAGAVTLVGPSPSYNQICANRTSLSFQ